MTIAKARRPITSRTLPSPSITTTVRSAGTIVQAYTPRPATPAPIIGRGAIEPPVPVQPAPPPPLLVSEARRPGSAGGVTWSLVRERPPADGLRLAAVVREAPRPRPDSGVIALRNSAPDKPGVRIACVVRAAERPGFAGAVIRLGYAPPERPQPRAATIVREVWCPRTALPVVVGSPRIASATRPSVVMVASARQSFEGSVIALGLRADPLPPPVLPRVSVVVRPTDVWPIVVQPVSYRAARGPDSVRARSMVVMERFRLPAPTSAIVWATPTIERVLLSRSIVVREASWPRSLLLPVLVYRSALFGSPLPPAVPDPVFDAEPVPLTDRFRGDGWPVFRTGR